MQYLDGILAENSTEAEVRAALDNMCGYLPASVQSEVSDFSIKFLLHSVSTASKAIMEYDSSFVLVYILGGSIC